MLCLVFYRGNVDYGKILNRVDVIFWDIFSLVV